MTTENYVFGVAAATTGGGGGGGEPAWFAGLPNKRWSPIADNDTIATAQLGQTSLIAAGGTRNDADGITKNWTGACVDQVRGEYLMVANGGHDGYAGNEVFALHLRAQTPKWYRLLNHTPAESIYPVPFSGQVALSTSNTIAGQGHNPDRWAAMYLDGRMRPSHTANVPKFANGKVWFATQPSTEGAGNSTDHAWSFNRSYPGMPFAHPSAGGTGALAHDGTPGVAGSGTAGPWTYLGRSEDGDKTARATQYVYSSGGSPSWTHAAYDPVTQWIWTPNAKSIGGHQTSLDTTGTRTPQIVTGVSPTTGNVEVHWSVVVFDPVSDRWRFLVVCSFTSATARILDLKATNPHTASWQTVTLSGWTTATAKEAGAVYHAPSRSILIGRQANTTYGANEALPGVAKIRVPTDPVTGAYTGSLTWAHSYINDFTAPTGAFASLAMNGCYSKFNIVNDMGNGRAALVVCSAIGLPTYVCPLPGTELF